jgi:hypothetical protein
MHSTLTPKPSDDPHDVVAVAPDAVRVAPSDEELSDLLQQAARYRLDSPTRAAPEAPAAPAVPPVDTTFRPAAVNDDVRAPGRGRTIGRGALRAFTALLLAASIGVAAFVWRSWGDTAEKKVARWATQFVMTTALPPEDSGPAAPPDSPAAQADAANAASPSPQLPAQNASAAAPSPDPAQLLQSMARDLASLGQEVELLKASIAELRTSQQQLSRDAAKAAETNAADIKAAETKASETKASETKASRQSQRSRTAAAPPRPATARARKPTPPSPPMQAAAPPLPLAGAPYYAPRQQEYAPRQFEPPPRGRDELTDPEYETVPRPPMPLR